MQFTKSLKTAVTVARVGTYLLVASGVGTIAGAAIAQVPMNPSGLDKIAVKFGAYALQATAVKYATATMDEGFEAVMDAIETVEQLVNSEVKTDDPIEGEAKEV